jgi:CspA family cold shock protein
MEGIVNSYSEQKGFGFITRDDGEEVSFYRSAIMMEGYKSLNGGDRVSFEVEETPGGPEAKNITKLNKIMHQCTG